MIIMRMMQPALDEIVGVIAVWHCGMAAIRAMNMAGFVTLVAIFGSAAVRVSITDFDNMLVNAIAARMMQMAVMKIINVIAMLDGDVSTAWTMTMRVFGGGEMAMRAHEKLPSYTIWSSR
jgi:hypothetical protein